MHDALSPVSQPRKRRKGGAKSKAGCLTCRIRHLKCDENKPSCDRCTSTGRLCDFVHPPHHSSTSQVSRPFKSAAKIIPISSTRQLQLRPKPAHSLSMPFALHEIDHFEYFRLVCTSSLSGNFANPLWKVILQISYSESSIRGAVVALSSLIRCQNNHAIQLSSKTGQESSLHYRNALRALNYRLDRSAPSYEVALIGSLIFTAFEALNGNDLAALQHLGSGLAVLKGYISGVTNQSDHVGELSSAFLRFEIQACCFAAFYRSNYSITPQVPLCFRTIIDAWNSLDSIVANMYYHLKPIGESQRTLPYTMPPSATCKQLNQIEDLHNQWCSAFADFSNSLKIQDDASSIAVKILQIHHLTARIYTSTSLYRDQLVYDAFTVEFTEIVNLATVIIDKSTRHKVASSFSFDIGIIHSLYFTACKCRNRILRHRALHLLSHSGIEGLWDGAAMASAACWAINLEEGEGVDDFIPEERRLREVGVMINRHKRKIWVVSTVKDRDGALQYLSATIDWGKDSFKLVDKVLDEEREVVGLNFFVTAWHSYIENSST